MTHASVDCEGVVAAACGLFDQANCCARLSACLTLPVVAIVWSPCDIHRYLHAAIRSCFVASLLSGAVTCLASSPSHEVV